jgi:anti-sigma B factor antagonist
MMVGDTSADALLLGADERGVFLRARGSIRATLCFPLRDALLGQIDKDLSVPAIHVDLSECRYMDSTFIGLLVAIDKKMRKATGQRMHVLRPSTECMEILSQIGLQKYLSIEQDDVRFPESMEALTSDVERPGADFILKAHEALMETSEEARRKFALLKEMLERKLRAEKPPKDTPEG